MKLITIGLVLLQLMRQEGPIEMLKIARLVLSVLYKLIAFLFVQFHQIVTIMTRDRQRDRRYRHLRRTGKKFK